MSVTALALFIFAYSFGAVIHINCYYDDSETTYLTAKVTNKRQSSGKRTTYYLELSTEEAEYQFDEVSVNKELYYRVYRGKEVYIYFQNGKLNIPWFLVDYE